MTQSALSRNDDLLVGPAIERASRWLMAARGNDGLWRDFWTPTGTSDHWVSAYVAATLARVPDGEAQAAALDTWYLLANQRPNDSGWGYHAVTPVDADSTCWALRLAQRLGRLDDERAQRALQMLAAHRVAGGIATYAQPDAIRAFVHLPTACNFSGWTEAHTCVTAAVAGLRPYRPLLWTDLLAAQQSDGSWQSYWWFSRAYATALAVEAIVNEDTAVTTAALDRAVVWATRMLTPDVSAFEGALLARVLLLSASNTVTAAQVLSLLLSSQTEVGSWRGSARLRIPRPDEHDPDRTTGWTRWLGLAAKPQNSDEILAQTFTIFSLDQASIFTTTTVLETLLLAQR